MSKNFIEIFTENNFIFIVDENKIIFSTTRECVVHTDTKWMCGRSFSNQRKIFIILYIKFCVVC